MSQETVTKFKFQFVDIKSRQKKGMMAKKGELTSTDLILNNHKIPLVSIKGTNSRDKRIVLVISNFSQYDHSIIKYIHESSLVLEVSKIKAVDLEFQINKISSGIFAERHKKTLESEGKGDLFKTFKCTNCDSIIDFSGFKTSDYIYCPYCYSVLDRSLAVVSNRQTFSHCDECNLFNVVQKYNVFIFYFLLLIYGFKYTERYLCGNCASSIGKKNLMLNLIFILGVPFSIFMILKSRKSSQKGEKELRLANQNVLIGNFKSADSYFNELRSIYPNHPGIIYNQARAHIQGRDYETGFDYLSESLDYCSNYGPALSLVNRLSKQAN